MNKKFIYSLCAAAFLMTGCDYNEDNFPGYDEGGVLLMLPRLFTRLPMPITMRWARM